jgi:hypothetical protein
MSALPQRDSLRYALELAVMFGRDAGRLAQDLARYQPGATAELRGYLSRLEHVLRDCSLGIQHATAALSAAVKAEIETR